MRTDGSVMFLKGAFEEFFLLFVVITKETEKYIQNQVCYFRMTLIEIH